MRRPFASSELAEIERRGKAMVAFCEGVRERGDRAVVEEDIDLPRLRARWVELRTAGVVVTTLNKLGPTPVDLDRIAALRRQIARRDRRGP